MKKLVTALLAVVFALTLPLCGAWAASGDLDEIVNYQIAVDVNDDATLTMTYHIDWKVLDSTSEGPLTWVKIGIPNKHFVSMEALSDTIDSIKYDSSGGSYARIDLDRAYYADEVVSFDFEIVQDYMYQVGRDNEGEAVYEFTPGWFDDIVVDRLEIDWNADKVERIAPAAQQDKGYYTWVASLRKGERFTVTAGYPDDAFSFDIDKTLDGQDDEFSLPESLEDIVIGIFGFGTLFFLGWGFLAMLRAAGEAVLSLFEAGAGFVASKKAGKKITRTKVVYYPVCEGCGAARPEGEDTCAYCGRSFIKSEEVVTEEDIPAEENEIRKKNKDGLYAYSSEPNTFLRVHVVPVPASSSSRRHGSGSRGRSCACVSSCACACGCACACACAGGGRAGCSTKDFYNTDLKLSQLRDANGRYS